MIVVNTPKGHTYLIHHQYHDPITDITATGGNARNYQQTNIPLPNIIAYLTQNRTYPFSPTPAHFEIPRLPISFYPRMRDENNLLLKSIQNSFTQKLLIKESNQIKDAAATYTTATKKIQDSCFQNILKTGSVESIAVSKIISKLFHLSLTPKAAIVENKQEHNLAIASDNDNVQQKKVLATNAASHMLTTTTTTSTITTNTATNVCKSKTESPSTELEDFFKTKKIDDIKMAQQQNTKMSAKENISKMSLNLNGTTTDAGNGKSNLKKTVVTPKTPKTPLELTASLVKSATPTTAEAAAAAAAPKKDKQHLPATVSFETKLSPRTPPVTPDSPYTYIEDDMNSVYSFATTTSGRSTMSCEHPYVALNGTTFSGRKMKYVVHCSAHAGQIGPDYLTPTQRAQRQLRRLKEVLSQARQDLEQKDSEIVRLTREVVELRLFKASLSSPDERSASSDAITVREAELKTSQDVSPIVDMVDDVGGKTSASPRHMHATQQSPHSLMHSSTEMHSSCADSGNFEDMTSSSVNSKDDSYHVTTHDIACGSDDLGATGDLKACSIAETFELQRQELIRMYEQKIEELIRSQDAASSEVKRVHNDKMEALLMKLAECNTRYADIVPDYEHAKERIRELEVQLEDLQHKLAEHEDKQKKMYLHMYQKGQEAERINRADQALEMATRIPNSKVSVSELLLQLQNTQDELENIRTIYKRLLEAQKNRTHVDPEVTLQFLKSAIYYFLTDRENSQGHLQAIESILEFTEAEKQNISKARLMK